MTRTFSKIYGLAGLRVGWGYGSKEIIDVLNKIKPPFNVNKAALSAASAAVKDINWLNKEIKHVNNWNKKRQSFYKSKNFKIEIANEKEEQTEIDTSLENFSIRE